MLQQNSNHEKTKGDEVVEEKDGLTPAAPPSPPTIEETREQVETASPGKTSIVQIIKNAVSDFVDYAKKSEL